MPKNKGKNENDWWQAFITDHSGRSAKELLEQSKTQDSLVYVCWAEETAPTTGKNHAHGYLVFSSPASDSALRSEFPNAQIEEAKGTPQKCIDYIKKGGKWKNTAKADTSVPGTFVEWGDRPPECTKKGNSNTETKTKAVWDMIVMGKSDREIMQVYPSFMTRNPDVEWARNAYLRDKSRKRSQPLDIQYVFAPPGNGKTNYVMGQHKKRDFYIVTDYKNPYEGYMGEKAIFFDNFEDLPPDFPFTDLVRVLDPVLTMLPCRGSNRWACFTHVYFASCDDPLTLGIGAETHQRPRAVQKLLDRITNIIEIRDGKVIKHGTAAKYERTKLGLDLPRSA